MSGLRCVAAQRAIDQQGFRCAADAGAPHFGVENDFLGHVERGRPVDEDVADTFKVREYRHPRFCLNARDQAFAAARHDDVDVAVEAGEHQADGRAVAGRDELNRRFRQAGSAQPFGQRRKNRAARTHAVGTAAQDRGVAGFQAQHAGVGGHIRPALINDADDAERHADTLDSHAVGPRPGFDDGANGILERAHDVDAGGDGLHARRRQARAGQETPRSRPRRALRRRLRRWRPELAAAWARTAAAMSCRARFFCSVGAKREDPGGRTGAAADLAHGSGDIAGCPRCF